MAATIETLPEFNPRKESFTAFAERVQLFLSANGMREDEHAAVLLSAIDAETYAILRNLVAPALPKEKTFDQIVKALADHFEPQRLVIAERFRFHRRNQHPDESVAEFGAEISRLARDCEFRDHLDEALRDRFVCGVQNEDTQKRLLSEPNLNFIKALEIAQTMEAAARNAQQLKRPSDKPLIATLEIDGVEVPMEVDTGSAVSLLSEETQKRLFPKGRLHQSKLHLKSYTSESIPVVGVLRVQVKYQAYYIGHRDLYVVRGNGLPLLGRDWLKSVRLDWHRLGLCLSLTLNKVIEEQYEVFRDKLELMTEYKAKLVTKPGVKSIFVCPRLVLFALREPVERELERLEAAGVIEKGNHSDWAKEQLSQAPVLVHYDPSQPI